jgi:hypothetical protein
MDKHIVERFIEDYGLTGEQIERCETFFQTNVLPFLKQRYLSHLVSTIEDLINGKQKQDFLKYAESLMGEYPGYTQEQHKRLKDAVNKRQLRLFSIILVPIDNGKINARTHFIGGCALITYWKRLDEMQKRMLIAHELGHVVSRCLFNEAGANMEGIATLFGFIAMCDKDNFYKNETLKYTHQNTTHIYNEIVGLCKRTY